MVAVLSAFKARQPGRRVVPTQRPVCRRCEGYATFGITCTGVQNMPPESKPSHRTGQSGRKPRQGVILTPCRGFLLPTARRHPYAPEPQQPTRTKGESPSERVIFNGRCRGQSSVPDHCFHGISLNDTFKTFVFLPPHRRGSSNPVCRPSHAIC